MRCFNVQTFLACLFLLGGDVLVTAKGEQKSRVVQLSLQRSSVPDPVAHDQQRRARRKGVVQGRLDNERFLYYLNTTLGSPPQKLRLHVDTGSSDLWVNSPDSEFCQSRRGVCDESGTYTANSSSTYAYLGSDFTISYVDGSAATGDYVTDTLKFGDVELRDFQFGIGYSSSSAQGVLGIGYPANEVQAVVRPQKEAYRNLPARLLADGHTKSNTYSVWLDDLDSATGSLMFGGIDKSQYHGDLVTVPVQRSGSAYREFAIVMTALSIGSDDVSLDEPIAVLLDTGSSLTYLPTSLTRPIFERVNATWMPEAQAAAVPCSLAKSKDKVVFSFSKPASVSVPMSELVLEVNATDDGPSSFRSEKPVCLFGISPAQEGAMVLGDTFLRSAYVVYDIGRNEISLAQSNFDAKPRGADVVEIGGDGIPGAIRAPNPVAVESVHVIELASVGGRQVLPGSVGVVFVVAAYVVGGGFGGGWI